MRRARKITLWLLLALLLPVVVVVTGILGFVYLAGPQTWTAALETALAQAESPDMQFQNGTFRRDVDGNLQLDRLTILDGEGPWLTLDDAVVDLRPWVLLQTMVDIDAVRVGRIRVLRPPADTAITEPEPATPFAFPERLELPGLPVAIRLGQLQIDEIVLAEGVAPEPTRLKLAGSADLTPNLQRLKLDVVPLDLGASFLRATIMADPATRVLTVDIAGDLPVIAPLDQTIGAPADARIRMTVEGGGPLDAARLNIDAGIDGVGEIVGDLLLSIRGEAGAELQLNAVASLIGGITSEIASLIGPSLNIGANLKTEQIDDLRVQDLSIQSDHLSVKVSGTADLDALTVDLTGDSVLRFHDGLTKLAAGAQFRELRLQSRLTGPLDALKADLKLTAADLLYEIYSAESAVLELNALTDLERAQGTLTASLLRPATGDPELDALAGNTLRLSTEFRTDAQRLSLVDLALQAEAATLNGDVDIALGKPAASGKLRVVAQDLRAIPHLAELLSAGQAELDISLNDISPDSGTAAIAARISQARWRDPGIAGLIGSQLTLSGTTKNGENIRAAIDLDTGGPVRGRVEVNTDGDRLQGGYTIDLQHLPAGLSPPELGDMKDIRLAGRVTGTVEQPRTVGSLTAGSFSVDQFRIERPVINYSARDLTGNPTVRLDGGAQIQDAPLRFVSAIRGDLTREQVVLESLQAQYSSLVANAALSVNLNSSLAAGQILIAADDLSAFSDLAGTALEGDVATQIDLSARGNQQDAVLLMEGTNVATDAARISRMFAQINLSDLLGTAPVLSGSVSLNDIEADTARIAAAELNLGGDLDRPALALAVDVASPAAARLTTTVQIDLTRGETIIADVTALEISAEQGTIATTRPFSVTAAGDSVTLNNLDLTTSFGGRLTGQAVYSPGRIMSGLSLKDLLLGPLAEIAGQTGFGGRINAKIDADTAAPGKRADITIDLTDLTVPEMPAETPFTVSARADWTGDNANARLNVAGPFKQPLVLQASGVLPYQPGMPIPTPAPGDPVAGKVSWQGELRQLMALLPENDHLLSGTSGIDVDLDGTWSNPRLKGVAEVTSARYENLQAGTILQDIGLRVSFQDDGVGQFRLNAADPEGGTLSGQGDLVLLGPALSADIAITLQKLLAVRRDEARAQVSGTTNVRWDGTNLDVVSRHTLDRVDVFLAAPDLPPSIVAIQLERDKQPEADETIEVEPGSAMPVNLDIQVSSDGQFFVRGRGLESEWRGDLTVGGTADEPLVRSTFTAVRGSLSLLGRDFKLDVGELGLAEDLSPTFRIELLRETPDLTGRIIVSGDPAQPDISFSATPDLPQDEVLPRLLFDKAKQSLSALEALNLAQGIRTLTNGKPGTTDQIRDAVGLDVLRFEEGDTEDSAGAVSVGRYVREGVYVGAKKSVDSNAGSVVVEIDILPNVKVDAEVVQDGNSSTGITFERKY